MSDIIRAQLPSIESNFGIDLAVSMGFLPGYSIVDKFGFNPLITSTSDPEDIWEGGGLYNYDDFGTAPIVSLASNNAGDTVPIAIQGLDIDGNLAEYELTLQGTARVALTTPLWRIFRMENEGDVDLVGTVFCYTGTGAVPSIGDANVRAIIDNGNNQTQMALYTIPKGKVGFLYKGELGIEFTGAVGAGTQYARVQYKSRRKGKIFKVKKTLTLINVAQSIYSDDRCFRDVIPDLTDIRLVAQEVSDDMGVWAAFCILLVDQERLSQAFRNAIGQSS